MDQLILNIIHRPEMVPEYAEKVTGHGKAEDLGRKALLTESLDIFRTQQECAHKNGLKTTIQMTYASLFNAEAVALAMAEGVRRKLGADFGVSTTGLAGPGGGTDETPVGTVFIAVAGNEGTTAEKYRFTGRREQVKFRASQAALAALRAYIKKYGQ